jgi:hypothetical protein
MKKPIPFLAHDFGHVSAGNIIIVKRDEPQQPREMTPGQKQIGDSAAFLDRSTTLLRYPLAVRLLPFLAALCIDVLCL